MADTRSQLAGEVYPAGVEGVNSRLIQLASGLRVRVVESGAEDAPPIVLVPGWGCSAWIFHDNLKPLAASGFHAIAVELKGHGLSDKPVGPGEYTVASMRSHLIDILDALDLEETAIIGHSMGAAIAAHAAAFAPSRVSSLAMAAPVGFAGVKGMGLFRAITPAFMMSILPLLATRGLIRMMLKVVYGSLRGPSARDVEEFHAQTKFPEFTTALRQLLHEFDWHAPFPRLATPTFAIAGSEDILCSTEDLSRYSRQTLVVEQAGHVLFDEAPAILNKELVSFFEARGDTYISSQNE